MFPLKEEKINQKENDCKGLFWRGKVSTYLSIHRSLETRKSLRLLKRMSCTGCPRCEWLWEYLQEDIGQNGPEDYLPEIEDMAIYTFRVPSSQGYYDQYPEIEAIEFIKTDKG